MQRCWHYRHSGVDIASDFAVPEWDRFARPAGAGAGAGEVTLAIADPLPAAEPGDVAFAVAGVGAYLVRGGRAILVRPDPAADPAQWRLFVLGSAWGALGYQRGWALWHAGAAARAGRAVLVLGDSGAGKSTLVATLAARGAALVGDDLVRLDPGAPGGVRVWPAGGRVKLWGDAVARLGWQDAVAARDWLREDKFHCRPPALAPAEPALPVAAIVVLAGGAAIRLERLRGSAALAAVMAAGTYRPEFLDTLSAWPQQAALAARACAQGPVYRLHRPRDVALLDDSAACLETLWEPDRRSRV